MIELVLVYCLSDAPDRCVERHQILDQATSARSCTIDAQFYAQEYVEAHPAYQLKGWRCEIDKPQERHA